MEVLVQNQTKSGEAGTHKILVNKSDKIKDFTKTIKTQLNIKLPFNSIGVYFNNENNKKINLSNKEKNFGQYGIEENAELILKNFGTQVDWRLVYVVEYFGPFLIFPSFYLFNLQKANFLQNGALAMGVFHYGKRILESLFVHSFSRDTMPIKNLYVNVFYYWLLFGISCGYSIFNNSYTGELNTLKYLYLSMFFVFEFFNFKCHMMQKKAKEESKGEYKILPGNYGFQWVSCANYFWEFLSWTAFSLFTGTWNSWVFTLCGFSIMTKWALEKHRNFKNLFGNEYPKNRKAMLPFII